LDVRQFAYIGSNPSVSEAKIVAVLVKMMFKAELPSQSSAILFYQIPEPEVTILIFKR